MDDVATFLGAGAMMTSDFNPSEMPVLGVGAANDLCERGIVEDMLRYTRARLVNYLTIYLYDNYTPSFLVDVRQRLPPALKFVWHASGDFELPYVGDSIAANRARIDFVRNVFAPAWATEDLVVTNFGRTRTQGAHPNYVPLFLTEETLSVCIRRMKAAQASANMLFLPEVPHFYMPVPEDMHLCDFLRRFTDATNCYLNFDVGHFFSYNLLHRRPLLDRIEEFPFHRVVEINSAGGMVGDAEGLTWIDQYSAPLNTLTEEALAFIIPRCRNLKAIYTETIHAEDSVVRHNLERLNELFWNNIRPGVS